MQQVHNAFMGSASHRGHTLDPRFRFIGVGEGIEDMGVFDADQFAAALVDPVA